MELKLIRNATAILTYAGKNLLLDPCLGDPGSGPSYAGKARSPLVPLPIPAESVLERVGALVVSHVHSDHLDAAARDLLPRHLPLLCQPEEAAEIRQMGFMHAVPIRESHEWEGIRITRIPGRHGTGNVLEQMGSVSGFLFESSGEPLVYWTGDTVLTDEIRELIRQESPEVILTHSCGAVWGDGILILMDDQQTVELCRLAPASTVVAIHMEAVDHATVSRQQLRQAARNAGVPDEQLLIPLDGETITRKQARPRRLKNNESK